MVSLTSNTEKEYPCTMCGSSGNIVREDATNPRLKCNSCGFMYNGKDSLAAKEAGTIPDGPPEIKEDPPLPALSDESHQSFEEFGAPKRLPLIVALPRTPTHVVLSKDRREFEFVTRRTLKKEVLKWTAEGRSHDVFKLEKVDISVNISVDEKKSSNNLA